MSAIQYKLASPIGPLYLVTSDTGLQGVFWKRQKANLIENLQGASTPLRFMKQTIFELAEYFEGRRKQFEVPLDIQGTDFQKRVWRELRKIPYGKTMSYKEIAIKVGTKGMRAVGTANGRNPLSLIIPCHRVIATGGGLGGYAGGLKTKQYLLDLERSKL